MTRTQSLAILAEPTTPHPPAVAAEGLYVHVPFCRHKCHYCDFYSITRQPAHRMEQFVDLVLKEADGWSGGRRGPEVRPRTVFFGGGTPTLLPVGTMRRLLRGLKERFDFSDVVEWTVEANPATVNEDAARMLREEGVNRLSFGAQSFAPGELATLERQHDPADVPRSVAIARAAGFARLNVDLIYAIPGQDVASWRRSLESAIALGTEHISCYALTYEPNTPMAVRKRLGQVVPAEEQVELEMMRVTRRRLSEAGLPPYEISNYAQVGGECQHNLMYWNGGNYIGLGPSAASHVTGWRWKNRGHLGEWERSVSAGQIAAIDVEHLDGRKRAGELAMLQLRLTRGVEFADFADRTGFDAWAIYRPAIEELAGLGLIDVNERSMRLNERGVALADAIAARFL